MWTHASFPTPQPNTLDNVAPVSPVYIVLILGMVIFMASNAMPGLLPDPTQLGHLAPFILQWGFLIVIFALLATMMGIVPGVPSLHITYVHMACAGLIFGLMWNHIVAQNFPDPPKKPSSSSSSSSSSRSKESGSSTSSGSSSSSSRSKEKEVSSSSSKEKKEKSGQSTDSPWSDLRAHPSAFLTTRMNRMLPWPFPMGQATEKGSELWWESGTPSHVGHYNKPADAEPPKTEDKKDEKKKAKEGSSSSDKRDKEKSEHSREKPSEEEMKQNKMREMEKEKATEKERMMAQQQATAKAKEADAARPAKDQKASSAPVSSADRGSSTATSPISSADRDTRKIMRTKYLAMIIGLSFVDKTLGFFLLLFYSIRVLAQELNGRDEAAPIPAQSGKPAAKSPSSSAESKSLGDEEAMQRAKMEKMKAVKEAKAAKAKAEGKGGSSAFQPKEKDKEGETSPGRSKEGSSSSPSSASSSRDKERSSGSNRERSSSSSSGDQEKSRSSSSSSAEKSAEKPITSSAVREASGSKTVTTENSAPVEGPRIGMGMHYIHVPDANNALDSAMYIPSDGMVHPLMTALSLACAN